MVRKCFTGFLLMGVLVVFSRCHHWRHHHRRHGHKPHHRDVDIHIKKPGPDIHIKKKR